MDKQMDGAAFPKLDTMRWQNITCQRIHVTLDCQSYHEPNKEGY